MITHDPLDVLQEAILIPSITSRDVRKPGAIIALLGAEKREALARLTSDDLARVRVDAWEIGGK